MFFRRETTVPGAGGAPASALRTLPSGSAPSPARPPAMRPERRRKDLRSRFLWGPHSIAGAPAPLRCCLSDLLMSMDALLRRRITIDAVKRLNFCGVGLVLWLALVARADLMGRWHLWGAHCRGG